MANFILALDGDRARRDEFARRAHGRVALTPGLVERQQSQGDLAIVWAAGRHAPWSEEPAAATNAGDGRMAVLVGHAIDETGQRLDAAGLAAHWRRTDLPTTALDGYHLGLVFDGATLTIGVDLLGFFPIYYWQTGGLVLVSTSCEMFGAHPAFRAAPCVEGIAGMLMINGLVGNQALLAGVRRLPPGYQLVCERATAGPNSGKWLAREQLQYRLATSERFASASFDELIEVADAAMRRAMLRHTPPGAQPVQLLSGGLDSRVVTGYIHRLGIESDGLCLGQPCDFEARAAQSVARAYGMRCELVEREVEPDEFVEQAASRVRWLHLSAGIGCAGLSDANVPLEAAADCFWSGMSMDDLLGGGAFGYGYDESTQQWSFEVYAKQAALWGLDRAQLARLFAPSGGAELIESVHRSFEADYHHHDDAPHRLAYRARLQNRHRYHLGNVIWQLSFASWPLLAAADREWLETFIDMPPAMSMHKQIELELVRRKFPELIPVPLDVNSWHHDWISPTWRHRVRRRVNKIVPIERAWNDWYWRRLRGIERRRYWRFYDFDLPNWRAVRQHAEPLRAGLETWLDRGEVDRLLPPPQAELPKRNAFAAPASRRNLLGLAMWSNGVNA